MNPPVSSLPDHPLFHRFPAHAERTITLGRVPAPYVVYDGYGLLIAGTINSSIAMGMVSNEDAEPVMTAEGRTLAGMWVCDFTHANLGPHRELQFFIAVTRRPLEPVAAHPLILLRLLLADPALGLFCYRLWNDSERVVAYNRELLGLDAHLARGRIEPERDRTRFAFRAATGEPLVEGAAGRAARTPPGLMWQIFRLLGPGLARHAAPGRILESRVINPKGHAFPDNRTARAYLAPDHAVVQRWDAPPARNRVSNELRWSADPFADADFRPTFVEHLWPYRFVYCEPE